jgi:hypothetical protein
VHTFLDKPNILHFSTALVTFLLKNASDLISKQKQETLLVPFHVIAMDPENWSTVSGGMAGSFGNGA